MSENNHEVIEVQRIIENCIECGTCIAECKFLQRYGTPKKICEKFLASEQSSPVFSCNLCFLCQVVCPLELDVPRVFFSIRKILQANLSPDPKRQSLKKEHNPILRYEKVGASFLFSYHKYPEGCRSVFFPGCALLATKPGVTRLVYTHLKAMDPALGIVLDCCLKPSHDLGLSSRFNVGFSKLLERFSEQNIKKIYTACPSCFTTFRSNKKEIEIVSIYELLDQSPLTIETELNEKVTVHDACSTRFISSQQEAVRSLIKKCGASIEEMDHSRIKTVCCGEGASACFVEPEITDNWLAVRKRECGGKRVITYCAGCSSRFHNQLLSTHILDLLFNTDKAAIGTEQHTMFPFTYSNRLYMKYFSE